jgi:acyl-[acyl carrier protein]--UDP-N-acetylglucosamine O-acyltransferase
MKIDPTARVADGARLGEDVEIGPYCLVGPQVDSRARRRLIGHVNVTGVTTIGEGTVVYPFCSLGTPPQSVHYRGGPTRLVIGAHCELARKRDHEYRHRRRRRHNPRGRALHVHGRVRMSDTIARSATT